MMDEEVRLSVVNKINDLLDEIGRGSRTELSDILGYSEPSGLRMMLSRANIPFEKIPKICDFLGITPDILFGYKNDEKVQQPAYTFSFDELARFPRFFNSYEQPIKSILENAKTVWIIQTIGKPYFDKNKAILQRILGGGANFRIIFAEKSEINTEIKASRSQLNKGPRPTEDDYKRVEGYFKMQQSIIRDLENSCENGANIEVRTIKYVPPLSMILINPEKQKGPIVFELPFWGKSPLVPKNEKYILLRMATILEEITYPDLYNYLLRMYENIWQSAWPWQKVDE